MKSKNQLKKALAKLGVKVYKNKASKACYVKKSDVKKILANRPQDIRYDTHPDPQRTREYAANVANDLRDFQKKLNDVIGMDMYSFIGLLSIVDKDFKDKATQSFLDKAINADHAMGEAIEELERRVEDAIKYADELVKMSSNW